MKNKKSDERTELLKDIFNRKEYYDGIKLSDLYVLIKAHPKYKNTFGSANKNNKDQWKQSTRALLQHRSQNMKHWNKRNKDFYYLGGSFYTSTNTKAYWESFKETNKILNEVDDAYKKGETKEEKMAFVKVRLNQTKYRDRLIEEFDESPIKTVKNKAFLIASHIVDYSLCKNEEDRANPKNGLLLSPDVDKLFDRKEITFDHITGKIVFIGKSFNDYKKMGVSKTTKISKKYLSSDRAEFLKKRNRTIIKT